MSCPTHCPNCGAPIDPTRDRCEYCDSAYLFHHGPRLETTADATALYQAQTLAAAFSAGVITANEARRVMGLPGLTIHANAPGLGGVRLITKEASTE